MASWLLFPQPTILGFAEPSFEIIEREVAHLILQTIKIHDRIYRARG